MTLCFRPAVCKEILSFATRHALRRSDTVCARLANTCASTFRGFRTFDTYPSTFQGFSTAGVPHWFGSNCSTSTGAPTATSFTSDAVARCCHFTPVITMDDGDSDVIESDSRAFLAARGRRGKGLPRQPHSSQPGINGEAIQLEDEAENGRMGEESETGRNSAPEAAPATITNELLRDLHFERLARQRQQSLAATQALPRASAPAAEPPFETRHPQVQAQEAVAAQEKGGGGEGGAGRGRGRKRKVGVSSAMLTEPEANARSRGAAQAGGLTRRAGPAGEGPAKGEDDVSMASADPPGACHLSVLTYNVWFNEEAAVERRMAAIGDIIGEHQPDVICLQEATPRILQLLLRHPSLRRYNSLFPPPAADYFCAMLSRLPALSTSRLPFRNSIMGRELLSAVLSLPQPQPSPSSPSSPAAPLLLLLATTHLESPVPMPPVQRMFSEERRAQAEQALRSLQAQEGKGGTAGHSVTDLLLCGDMNWEDGRDGQPPLAEGWVDAWQELRPDEPGFTYDGRSNAMLGGSRLRLRLDRAFCRLHSLALLSVQLVGQEALPGCHLSKQRRVKGRPTEVQLPVLPSDHFGVLLRLRRREG